MTNVNAAAVVLLAFLLREWFVLAMEVQHPIRGDIVQYVAYAWNLVQHQTFSASAIGSPEVIPDAFRGPGYPAFLATAMLLGGTDGGWYPLALQFQVILGTATVLLTILLGRRWMHSGWAALAGALLALWPHHIAATGALLSEVLFGFLLVLGLWLLARGTPERPTARSILAAGVSFGCAYLVNPVVFFFPLLAALLFWRIGWKRPAVLVALVPLVLAGAWSLRNATLPDGGDGQNRAIINLVQGSWPIWHKAYAFRFREPQAKAILQAANSEIRLLHEDVPAGLRSIAERMAHDPGYYMAWYGWQKHFLLWDWNIRVGAGDVYFLEVENSPLERSAPLAAVKRLLRIANPAVFLLAVLGIGWALWNSRQDLRRGQVAPTLVATCVVYLSLVHWVFQAEPRYSIPYRPEQLLLAAWTLSAIVASVTAARQRRTTAHTDASRHFLP